MPATDLPCSSHRRTFWYTLGALAGATATYLLCLMHPDLWDIGIWPQGFTRFGEPFIDMRSHLAACYAMANDLVVYGQPIPGDPMSYPYDGPKWLFWFGYLGLGPAHTIPMSGLCLVMFLVAVGWLLKPQSLGQAIYVCVVLSSPPLLLLVERGNVELFIVAFLVLAFSLVACESARARWAGWAVVTAFIGFKYYPASGYSAVLESPGPRREKWFGLALGFASVVVFVGLTWREIRDVASFQWENSLNPFFGCRELWTMIGHTHEEGRRIGQLMWLLGSIVMAYVLGPMTPAERRIDFRKPAFVGGASILTFCFLTTSSPDYRLVHFLFCVPWLWVLRREAEAPASLRALATLCLVAFPVVPWLGVIGARSALNANMPGLWWTMLLVKQFGWWTLMFGMGGLLLRQVVPRLLVLLGRSHAGLFRGKGGPFDRA